MEERSSLPIPDELLEEIFLRLPDPADLVRASVTCVSFRRVSADRSFLRRYGKLHAPPFLGFLDALRFFQPAEPPHPSARAASAAFLAADFTFSFLPAPARDWCIQDVRDGRVLLDRDPHPKIFSVVFPELVVCDPLHRRYHLLPRIPANLAASVEDPLMIKSSCFCETFLAPHGDDDDASAAEETSFRVVWMAQCVTKVVAFVYSSNTGQWCAISSQSWSDLFAGLLSSVTEPLFSRRQYAYGCFYWVESFVQNLLVFDTRKMQFSIAEPPREARGLIVPNIAIVEAGEGRPGMFMHTDDINYLNYAIRQNNCVNSSQWQLEESIPLDSGHLFLGSTGGHLFLYKCRSSSLDADYFLMDVKTFQLETVFVSNSFTVITSAYYNFPPSLSTPTVSSGIGNGQD